MNGDDLIPVRREDLAELVAATHAFLAPHSRFMDQRSRELVAKVRGAALSAEEAMRRAE